MSWYELLLFLHILAIATWFGSGLAIMVLATRAISVGGAPFGTFTINAGWWASRAHPAAGVVLLLTGFGMVADADLSLGDTWLWLGIVGLVAAFGVGGALIGRTSDALTKQLEASGGVYAEQHRPLAEQLILYARIELAVLVLVIADMVAKPGL
jgi:hypothetical protein